MASLLYIDTSGSTATIALSVDGKKAAYRRHENAMEQAAVINVLIEEVMAEAGLSLQALDAVAVCAGPGSYTGLRVGMSTAKGLCYALDKPLLLFSRMLLIALDMLQGRDLWVILKARQEEYFAAAFDRHLHTLQEPKHYFGPDLAAALENDKESLLVTDVPQAFGDRNIITIAPGYAVDIDKWIPAAEDAFSKKQFADLAYADPYYLKAAFTTQSKK